MSDLHGWQRLMVQREARASGALDGETMHVAAPDGSCCLDHARERIAELEDANTRMRQRLEDVEALKADAVKLEEMTLLEGMWRKRVAELEAEVTRLRARNAELEGQDARWQVMVDRIAGQSADYLLRAREAERRVAKLVAVLREVEWSGAEVLTVAGYPPSVVAVCPICQKPKKSQRHYSDCALDAALRKADD